MVASAKAVRIPRVLVASVAPSSQDWHLSRMIGRQFFEARIPRMHGIVLTAGDEMAVWHQSNSFTEILVNIGPQ